MNKWRIIKAVTGVLFMIVGIYIYFILRSMLSPFFYPSIKHPFDDILGFLGFLLSCLGAGFITKSIIRKEKMR